MRHAARRVAFGQRASGGSGCGHRCTGFRVGCSAGIRSGIGDSIWYGVCKNRYIARTFIQPEQGQRENSVRIKLNALASVVKGKRVIMVDDSIVRGTTSARIVTFCGMQELPRFMYGYQPPVYQPLLLRHRHRLQGKPDCLPDE